MLTPKFLLFYPRTSNYWPATDGEFTVTPEFGSNYVYKGRLLSLKEFNELDPEFWNPENHRSPVQVRCVMVDPDAEAKEAEQEDPTEDPASEGEPATDTNEKLPRPETPRESLAGHLSELPNKGELLEFAKAREVEIDSSAKRAEIETAILDALHPAE